MAFRSKELKRRKDTIKKQWAARKSSDLNKLFEEKPWGLDLQRSCVGLLAFKHHYLFCSLKSRNSHWLSFLSVHPQLALGVLMDTSFSGVFRLWTPFKWPTSTHTLIIALPRTCHQLICMTIWRAIMKSVCVCACECVCVCVGSGTWAADASMVLIICTADVRLAVGVPPLERTWTSNSFIVVKSVCLFCVGCFG